MRRTVRTGSLIVATLALLPLLGACAIEKPAEIPAPSQDQSSTVPVPEQSVTPSATPEPSAPPTFDKTARSIDDPNSIWVVVDKLRPLQPQDYTPPDLVDVPVAHTWEPLMRQEASDAIVRMFAAARDEAGLYLASNSAYRSYQTQVDIYDGNDSLTARPGYSEHQTGLVMDIGAESGRCSLDACFGETPEGQWLAANAWRFGFLLRYPADKTPVTGYEFEPWHYRYIGTDLAAEMHDTGVTTLEEYFGLPAAPNYP